MRIMRHIKRTFNLILTLAAMLTMAQTAWAATETRTATWYLDGGSSGKTTLQGTHVLISGGMTLEYKNNDPSNNPIFLSSGSKSTYFRTDIIGNEGFLEFTNLVGTVTKVELTNFRFAPTGHQMYVGIDMSTPHNATKLLHLQGDSNDYDYASIYTTAASSAATFEGSLDVSESTPLKIMFSGTAGTSGNFNFKDGTIIVTYEVEVEDTSDPGHTFTFAVNSSNDAVTATCTEGSNYHTCGLTNRQVTMRLVANDVSYDGISHYASLDQTAFNAAGITDIAATFSYKNKATNEVRTNGEYEVGLYIVTATVTINGTNYMLTKDFSILAGYKVNNNYSQFSLSKISALEGEAMSITYMQQMDEILEGLTLTGATSGNNIVYNQSGNTYTFNMPAENVNLSATFTYPLNENNITQNGDTYTIKTAEGWNYFCQRMEVDGDLNGFSGKTVMLGDNITVTTMAGSTDRPFKGMFDGDGHTLTFNYTADMPNCAPFHITNGATIRNLHATGQIDGGIWHYMGGLVGSASGNLTIENCRVSTQISSTINGEAGHGGIVGYVQYTNYLEDCNITGCVFDGLIYNSNTWNQTYGCGGFIGAMSQYGYAILKDCLFLHGQYDNNGNKCELYWGYDNDRNSTFFHRSNNYGEGKLTNCFYVATHFLKQGSPAVESATAPTNFAHFGDPTTDYGFLKVYGHTMVFDGKYYTPTYGDLVEEYDYGGGKSYNIEYDDKPLGIPDITTQLWVPLLRYKRTFTNGKPVTVMMPFNFTKSAFKKSGSSDGLTGHFYEFKGIHLDPQTSKWTAVMGEPDNPETTTMTANTPYLYVPDDEPEYWYIDNGGSGVNIFTQDNGGGNKVTPYDGSNESFRWNKWDFIGTYQPRYWYDGSDSEHPAENIGELGKVYGFAGATKEVQGVYNNMITVEAGEFVRAKSGAKIRPTSCYLMWTGYEPDYAPARGLTRGAAATEELPQRITVKLVAANGDIDAIGEIDTTTGELSFDGWYTLDGVHLDGKPTKKGLYINNGKKVVIK